MKMQGILVTALAVVLGLFLWERFLRKTLTGSGSTSSFEEFEEYPNA